MAGWGRERKEGRGWEDGEEWEWGERGGEMGEKSGRDKEKIRIDGGK